MIEKYHKPIFETISEKGALGVNQIAKLTDIPVSTLQKYLSSQQTYFRKTSDRRWDLPERVNSDITDNTLVLNINSVENTIQIIQAQLLTMQQTIANTAIPLDTLKRGIEYRPAPVADKVTNVENERLKSIMDTVKQLPEIIKNRKENLTDEMLQIVLNVRWLDLILDLGRNYFVEVITPELHDLLLGVTQELDEGIFATLKEYCGED